MSGTITGTITTTVTLDFNPTTIAPGGFVSVSGVGTPAISGPSSTAWSLVNEGRVESEAGLGVSLASGGSVDNAAGALIESGTTDAVRITGSTATIDNAGIILAAGSAASAVYGAGGPATILNTGSIAGWNGIRLLAGGYVTNAASGVITNSRRYGVDIGGTLSNNNTNNAAVVLYGGSIGNLAGGVINAQYYHAIYISGGTVTNAGTIENTSTTASVAAIDMASGGVLDNQRQGLIISAYQGVLGTGGAVTLTNAGTIAAATSNDAVLLAGDFANRVIVDPGGVFIGTVAVGTVPVTSLVQAAAVPLVMPTEASTLELAAGTVSGSLGGLGTQFAGFQQTTIDSGASWTLTGVNTLVAGYTLTDSGTLTNAGFLTVGGTLLVQDSLVNTGSINGTVTLEAGALLINLGGGTIIEAGSVAAVNGTYGPSSVFNAGLIAAADTPVLRSPGVSLAAGGTVTNATGGTIVSGGYGGGVYLGGVGGSVLNARGALIAGTGYGVGVVPNGGSGTVVNAGTIAATGTGDAGVFGGGLTITAPASNITLLNRSSGVITALVGVQLGGFVTATVINNGLITGDRDGMILSNAGTGEVYVSNTGSIVTGVEFEEPAGIGIRLGAPGTITNASTGLIAGKFYGIYGYDGAVTVINAGTIVGGVRLWAGFQNRVVVDPGAVFRGDVDGGAVASLAPANATLELAKGATAGMLTGVGYNFLNFGSIIFDSGAQWRLSGDIAGLTEGQTISGFTYGDTIEITGFVGTLVSYNDGTLTLEGPVDPDLILPGTFAPSQFVVTDKGGNTDITLMCFARGTRIATTNGPVAVEHLRVGDRVMTLGGDPQPVVWIGCRKVDCRHHPKPHVAWPVRVAAGAFAPRVPARHLFLSPEHCIFRNGVMIPVKELLDGTTVRQVETDEVTYYHVELLKHAVILAEGLTVESYLDTDGRANFANGGGVVRLFPDFASLSDDAAFLWEALGAAPRRVTGPEVEAVRALLAKRAATMRRNRLAASRRRSGR